MVHNSTDNVLKSKGSFITHSILPLLGFFVLVLLAVPASASIELISLDNLIADLSNGAYISVPYIFNGTNFSISYGQLEFWLNNSQMQWRTNTNKTITSIQRDAASDTCSFNVLGTNGYLNFSCKMNNPTTQYYLNIDGVWNSNVTSNVTKDATINYTGVWSTHTFLITPIYSPSSPGLGVPVIISFTSDITGASQYIQVASGTPITFTAIAPGASSYNWYIDKQIKSTHTSTYIYTTTGYHTISVLARNSYGDSALEYKNIVISQLTAVALIPAVNTSDYDTLENLIDAPDLVNIINFVPSPYTHFMGNTFYLILWALVGLMIWIRSDKITVPTTLGFIIGGVVIGMLPTQYQLIAQLIIVSGLFAALFIFFKEKK